MTPQERADAEARDAGIDTLEYIRAETIEGRGRALDSGNMQAAVFWSHVIWWLSKAQELLAERDQT